MISLVRVDDRLVHAQVVIGWIEFLRCRTVIVVDEEVADDPDRVELLQTVLPEDVTLNALDPRDAAKQWPDLESSADPCILLFADPLKLQAAVELGIRPKEVNLGGMHVMAGRHSWQNGLYASDEEIAAIRKMIGRGIDFEIRPIPAAKRREVAGDL